MPELPEVETIRRGLHAATRGQKIVSAHLRRGDLRRRAEAGMARKLCGLAIESVDRRAKYLIFRFAGSAGVMLAHLGMSGRFLFFPKGTGGGEGKHDHLVMELEGGGRMVFSDPRRFGFVEWVAGGALSRHPALVHLGPEPMEKEFTPAALAAALAGGRAPVKTALLDQRRIAGLGNIYICEALFRAAISPFRAAGSLGKAEVRRLHAAIRAVLSDAIAAGGSSLRDYVHADGSVGRFQENFSVYGREGAPCSRCHSRRKGVIARDVQAGRSTFYCPRCQE